MPAITISLGDELFAFHTFQSWVNQASRIWRIHGVRGQDTLCIDVAGRVCTKGAEFMRARDEGTFPIRVYKLVTDESLPASAAAGRIAPGLQDRPAGADEGCPEGCMGLTCSCLPQCDDLDPETDEVQP